MLLKLYAVVPGCSDVSKDWSEPIPRDNPLRSFRYKLNTPFLVCTDEFVDAELLLKIVSSVSQIYWEGDEIEY